MVDDVVRIIVLSFYFILC